MKTTARSNGMELNASRLPIVTADNVALAIGVDVYAVRRYSQASLFDIPLCTVIGVDLENRTARLRVQQTGHEFTYSASDDSSLLFLRLTRAAASQSHQFDSYVNDLTKKANAAKAELDRAIKIIGSLNAGKIPANLKTDE